MQCHLSNMARFPHGNKGILTYLNDSKTSVAKFASQVVGRTIYSRVAQPPAQPACFQQCPIQNPNLIFKKTLSMSS